NHSMVSSSPLYARACLLCHSYQVFPERLPQLCKPFDRKDRVVVGIRCGMGRHRSVAVRKQLCRVAQD
ncbi:hypothetical protein HDU84_001350, partial [Entophlyctis sp. JEL0112]